MRRVPDNCGLPKGRRITAKICISSVRHSRLILRTSSVSELVYATGISCKLNYVNGTLALATHWVQKSTPYELGTSCEVLHLDSRNRDTLIRLDVNCFNSHTRLGVQIIYQEKWPH